MSCRTSPAPYSSYVVTQLVLMVDGANFTLSNPFLYTPDPTIELIEPLQSFFSGGRTITVTGSQFTSIQQPRMLILVPRPLNMHHVQRNHLVASWPPYKQRKPITSTSPPPINSVGLYELNVDTYRLINESVCSIFFSFKFCINFVFAFRFVQ